MKIIQIQVIPEYTTELGGGVKERHLPQIIGLTNEGEVCRLTDAENPEERKWKFLK